jgi:hypothetical protein
MRRALLEERAEALVGVGEVGQDAPLLGIGR